MTPAAAAVDWIERGHFIVPIPDRKKAPIHKGWQKLRIPEADVPKYFTGAAQNIGVLLGEPYGAADLDLDSAAAIAAAAILAPDTGLKFGRASKRASHYFYRCDPPRPGKKYLDPTDKTCICELRCLKSDGTVGLQTVVPPSVHVGGEAIQFEPGFDGEPANIDFDELARRVAHIAAAALFARHWPAAGQGRHECELALAGCLARAGWSIDAAEQFVVATYRAVPDHDRSKFDRVRASVLSSFAKKGGNLPTTGYTTLAAAVGAAVAKAAMVWLGITADAGRAAVAAGAGVAGAPKEAPDLLPFLYNDHGNSLRLVAMYGDDLRYCPPVKKWMYYERRWVLDEEGRARRWVKAMFCEMLTQAVKSGNSAAEKFARECLDTKRITNALREAQDRLCIMPDDLDADPYALNCQNGTVDLRTGQIRPHRKEDFISKILAYRFDPTARCPRFLRFLDEVMGIGPDAAEAAVARAHVLVAFLWRAIGYSLTGVTTEKVVFILHGPKDNGKTTLLVTLLTILGEYGTLLSIDTLMAKAGHENNNAAADLADLRGVRIAQTSETEEGQRLAEGRLKRITQGAGRIKACRKYENPIEFTETHKLWIDANYLPVVRSGDEAIWRRLRAIPFSVVIPRERQDRELGSKLLAEAEGILAWAVAGAVTWYREGLGTVAAVEEHSNAWRDDMNQVLRFVDEAAVREKAAKVRARDLFHGYTRWAEGGGERPMTERSFSLKLIDLGFERRHDERGNYYVGIGLRLDQGEFG
jgi:P4 family phage/plasmid primase-like protien